MCHEAESLSLMCKPSFSKWIFDCGSTYTMTFDPNDMLISGPTSRSHIQTANGECARVDRADPVDVSHSIHLKNYLLIRSLSHKL